MNLRRRQWLGWSVMAAAALIGAGWLARLDFSERISTDVLDLIPSGERSPEITLVRELSGQAEARTMFFVLSGSDGGPAPAAAAERFAAELLRSPAFDQAVALADSAPRDALGRELFDRRFPLLFPLWLRERESAYAATGGDPARFADWLAGDTAASLNRFLATPEALAFQEVLPADPLLLMPGMLDRLKGGISLAAPAGNGAALVWARIAASPLREEGQEPVFRAIAQSAAVVRTEFPGLTVADTGLNRFAAASRTRIEHEVSWLNGLSLAAVLAVALALVRKPHRGLHLVPVVLLSVLGAWVSVTLAFPRVHILVFVVGSLLTGVAIDYGFYLFMQPPAWPGESYGQKVRRLLKPLLASCFTTVAGFALLLFSELPPIRQLGVFVGSGLLCALGAAVVYFSTVEDCFLEARAFRGGQAFPVVQRRRLRVLLILLGVAALPGLTMLQWKDDIRGLEVPSAVLVREDTRIRALFGDQPDSTAYLTYGTSIGEARAALEQFADWLRTTGGAQVEFASLGAVVPTPDDHARAVRFVRTHPDFAPQLQTALTGAGFEPGAFTPFFDAYANYAARADEAELPDTVASLQKKISGPLGLLLHTGPSLSWFVTVAHHAPAVSPPAALRTVSASQLQSLNGIFARYRRSALWLSLIGLGIVGGGVFLTYGWRDGVRIFAIPCGACLGVFGLFGWLGLPLNLFHLLGAYLGVCLTHNYSIFTATSAYRHEPPPVSVRLSALTAAASFGVLALSGIPVVRALGSTVALMVLAALLVIEFEHFTPLARKP